MPDHRRGARDSNPKRRAGVSNKGASPARLAALDVGRAARERDAFVQELITTRIDNSPLSPEDRAFATKLALGVASSLGTLDEVIDRALNKPSEVQPDVRDALRVSTYEIIFLDKSAHAAVDQGVELVRSFAQSAAGFANAVLRKVVGLRDSFPFGNPKADIEALARSFAFPVWLARKLVADLGAAEAVDFMRASNEPAPLFIAVNATRAREDEVVALFRQRGWQIDPVDVAGVSVPGCLRVSEGRALLDDQVKRLFVHGKILVSDAASQLIAASVLPDRAGAAVLEVGAGRATKTILLQSAATRTQGHPLQLTTLDNHEFKTKLLVERAARYHTPIEQALCGDALQMDAVVGTRTFDMVFIDAPCSGLGTLRRHPEIRWRLAPGDVASFARVQLGMLQAAASHVVSGGVLAYATCTVTHEENNGVVKAFLESEEGSAFTLAPIAQGSCIATRLVPGAADAHFAVRFVRTA